jgi:predicted RNA binding protein with dsRBD fold (UPF0201 family)
MKCEVVVSARVFPTEDVEKVIEAISNIFDYDELEIGDGYVKVMGNRSSLQFMKESLEKRRIREVARRIFLNGMEGDVLTFKISKQAAFVGNINFVEDDVSPLGDIEVRIQPNPDLLIGWLCDN